MSTRDHHERIDRLDHAPPPWSSDCRPRRQASQPPPRHAAAARRRSRSASGRSTPCGRRAGPPRRRPGSQSRSEGDCGARPIRPRRRILAELRRAEPGRSRSHGGSASASWSQVVEAESATAWVTGNRLLIIVRNTRRSSPVSRTLVGEVVDVRHPERIERRRSPRRSSAGPAACSSATASAPRRRTGLRAGPERVDPEIRRRPAPSRRAGRRRETPWPAP